jgi:hypothetical protein
MKKLALIIVALLTLSLGVCAQNKQQKEDKEMKKTLIVYFSATGTTKAHDLSGKTLNVFATSGSSDVKGSYNDLKNAYPQYTWGESRLMN